MDTIRGLKAGFGAGIIAGLVGSIISIGFMFGILYSKYRALFEQTLAKTSQDGAINIEAVMIISAIGMISIWSIIGVMIGAICGLIYAFLYDKLPGKTAIAKGLCIGFVYFIIISIFSLLTKTVFLGDAVASIKQDPLIISVEYTTNFMVALIFGYFLGWFWNDLEPKD